MVTRSDYTSSFFFFNDTATTEIYTLSLHDALPISSRRSDADRFSRHAADGLRAWIGTRGKRAWRDPRVGRVQKPGPAFELDRKSTRLNSSHLGISYAVFCLKKKKFRIRPTKRCL